MRVYIEMPLEKETPPYREFVTAKRKKGDTMIVRMWDNGRLQCPYGYFYKVSEFEHWLKAVELPNVIDIMKKFPVQFDSEGNRMYTEVHAYVGVDYIIKLLTP